MAISPAYSDLPCGIAEFSCCRMVRVWLYVPRKISIYKIGYNIVDENRAITAKALHLKQNSTSRVTYDK